MHRYIMRIHIAAILAGTILLALVGCATTTNSTANERAPQRVAYMSDLDSLRIEINTEIQSLIGGGDKPIAMFILKLNDEVRYSMESNGTIYTSTEMLSNFVDFELKASDNNFTGDSEDAKLKCYIPSIYSRPGSIGTDITRDYALILACDRNGTDDPRSWLRYDSRSSAIPTEVVVIVNREWLRRTTSHDWLSSSNTQLVWSYVKFTANSRSNDSNDRPIWTPCHPVAWFNSMDEIDSWAGGGLELPCICPICNSLHESGLHSRGEEGNVCSKCLEKRRSAEK